MYNILLFPLLSGFIAQSIKFFIKSNGQNFSFKNLLTYAGMPSGHSAMVISLTTIIGLESRITSPLFAVSVVLSLIVIRDAMGIRRYLGQHGKILNILVKDLSNDKVLEENYPRLLEQIGHTPAQVIIGGLIGFSVSLLGFLFLQ